MNTFARILAFGFVSGLLWSIIAGSLANLFDSRNDILATVIAGVSAGLITSLLLAPLVAKVGRGLAVVLGFLSLPFGAFAFGFTFALIDRFLSLANGSRALVQPWTLGLDYAVLSVISIFAIGLFPLAVLTTLLLRAILFRSKEAVGRTIRMR